jgi:hypothetical protein
MSADALALAFRAFRLPTMAAIWEESVTRAEGENWGYRRLLQHLCESEAQDRRERRVSRLIKQSGLPDGKTLGNLEEAVLPPKIRRLLPTLLDGGFVERAENVLAFGLPGRGKTHFLAAVARELVLRHRYPVLFTPTFKLMLWSSTAKASGRKKPRPRANHEPCPRSVPLRLWRWKGIIVVDHCSQIKVFVPTGQLNEHPTSLASARFLAGFPRWMGKPLPNKLETNAFQWEFLAMKTLTVDDRHRVTLPETEPGQVFAYEPDADGSIKLVPVVTQSEPKRILAKLVERDGVMIFELPEGYKLDPEDIGKAVAEERESRA